MEHTRFINSVSMFYVNYHQLKQVVVDFYIYLKRHLLGWQGFYHLLQNQQPKRSSCLF